MPQKPELSKAMQIKAESALAEKKERLAAALKENLRRRKLQKQQSQAPGLGRSAS